jgi:hypothetical protein
MALTEEQKKKIEEEEAYRAKVRDESHSQGKKKGCSGCLIAVLVIVGLLAMTLIAINPAKQFETAEKSAQATITLETKNGSFTTPTGEEYTYEITSEEGGEVDNRYVASFTPFLQNNDSTLLMATFKVFETTYGEGGRIVPTPFLEERNGRNLIRFAGDGETYYVFPIKEDTGEVHTLMFWKEIR